MNKEFQTHVLSPEGLAKCRDVAKKFSDLLDYLCGDGVCVHGRELAITKTKLEEACFYAKKALASNMANQKLMELPVEDLSKGEE